MTEPRRIAAIDIEEDINHERRSWKVERIGWALLALFVLLAAAGLFGKGYASRGAAGLPDKSLEVQYERFGRYKAPLTLKLRFRPQDAASGKLSLWIGSDYLRAIRIERMEPEPESRQVVADGVSYEFQLEGAEPPVEVIVHAVAQEMGSHTARLGPSPDKSLRFSQFIYP
jgi:hypothetical protein